MEVIWNSKIQKWYNKLSDTDKFSVYSKVMRLSASLGNSDVKVLSRKKNILELRLTLVSGSHRLTFTEDKEGRLVIVFLSHFKKSVQGYQVRDVQNAEKVLQAYRKGLGNYAPPVW